MSRVLRPVKEVMVKEECSAVGISIPIKDVEEIKIIKDLYKRKKQIRELLMFTISINTGIDLVGLLNLKVKDVKNKLYLKIDKNKTIPINDEIFELISQGIQGKRASDFLFQNKWGNKIDRAGVFHIFKNTCSELGLSKNYSAASWRKTFAYHYYKKYGDIAFLMWLFNQTTAEQALNFINETENINLRYKEGVCL